MPAGSTHASRDIYQRLAVNEVKSLQQNKKTVRDMQGLHLNYLKSGRLTDALVICFDNYFHIDTIPLRDHFHHIFVLTFYDREKNISRHKSSVGDSIGLMKGPKDLVRAG